MPAAIHEALEQRAPAQVGLALERFRVALHADQEVTVAALDRLERELIIEALKNTRGNKAKAAESLGITERIMGLRCDKHNIDPRIYKTARVV